MNYIILSIISFATSTAFAYFDAHAGGPKGLEFFYSMLFYVGGFVFLGIWREKCSDTD